VTAEHRYELILSPTARRQLAEVLPAAVAFAAHEFIVSPLPDNPQRVGKRLGPLQDRHSARRGTTTESHIAWTKTGAP
jgi:mRNA interferase RelE/StbE